MKRISLFLFMFIWVACSSNNNSANGLNRSRTIHPFLSGIFVNRVVQADAPVKKETQIYINSSYTEEVQKFQVPVHHYRINSNEKNDLTVGKRGTVLHIPKDVLVDQSGNPYNGTANIRYQEYTNSAEIAFSGIPMIYRSGKEELRFNSAGMFEIKATTLSGEELYIGKNKSITVDYTLVNKNPGTDFYRLDPRKNQWTNLRKIITGGRIDSMWIETVYYDRYQKEKVEVIDGDRTVKVSKEYVPGRKIKETGWIKYNTAEVDPGHTFPGIVSGLSISQFGIYNCDAVYRLANRVEVNASYVDKTTNRSINDLQVLSMIDLSYTGAFSFSPDHFICDSKARNVLLLFTQKGQLYFLDEKSFHSMKIQNDGMYTFKMTNISDRVKSTDDLKILLGI